VLYMGDREHTKNKKLPCRKHRRGPEEAERLHSSYELAEFSRCETLRRLVAG